MNREQKYNKGLYIVRKSKSVPAKKISTNRFVIGAMKSIGAIIRNEDGTYSVGKNKVATGEDVIKAMHGMIAKSPKKRKYVRKTLPIPASEPDVFAAPGLKIDERDVYALKQKWFEMAYFLGNIERVMIHEYQKV